MRGGPDEGWRRSVRLGCGTVLGGFTTYSTFVLEVERLASDGETTIAVAYLLVSVVLGLVLAVAGMVVAARFTGPSAATDDARAARRVIALLVALAGGLGAVARFEVDTLVARHNRWTVPAGTLVINVTSCVLLGMVVGWARAPGGGRPQGRARRRVLGVLRRSRQRASRARGCCAPVARAPRWCTRAACSSRASRRPGWAWRSRPDAAPPGTGNRRACRR
ncbi:CrcB family protein [Cellulomonas gelida]|uniref:CrcB family protein n=1 Tax=Cellulomonas gelida TaxID=1712 RepID=UPI00360F9862